MIPLAVRCPFCGASLMDAQSLIDGQPSIRVNMSLQGRQGALHLSSIYGSFRFDSSAPIGDGEVAELACPHCSRSLVTDAECEICQAPMARMKLEVDGEVFFCSRKGCKVHKVELIDLERSLELLYQSRKK